MHSLWKTAIEQEFVGEILVEYYRFSLKADNCNWKGLTEAGGGMKKGRAQKMRMLNEAEER